MRPNKLVVVLALCVLTVTGCKKKKQVQTPPPAPTISPSTTITQTQTPPQKPPVTQPQVQQPPPAQSTPPKTATKQTKPKPRIHIAKKPSPQKPANTDTSTTAKNTPPPPLITVDPASLPDNTGGVAASIPHSQETDERRTTTQLLQSTEDNLRSITRTLTSDEQATVAKIRSFMAQSQSATKDGDTVRAHNLALKAHLLSDELAKR